jgi:hypothetical protein
MLMLEATISRSTAVERGAKHGPVAHIAHDQFNFRIEIIRPLRRGPVDLLAQAIQRPNQIALSQ